MTPEIQCIYDCLPRAIRREARIAFLAGVKYMAGGVVWGAHGPRTAMVI